MPKKRSFYTQKSGVLSFKFNHNSELIFFLIEDSLSYPCVLSSIALIIVYEHTLICVTV